MGENSGMKHRRVHVNGIKMHVAEKGDEGAPVVLFLHGFPELWYTWRKQMEGLSSLGYRAVAPDMRGFGDTDAPEDASSYTYGHIVGDLVALMNELGLKEVFVVGHDWGAVVAWWLCLFRPDRVKALVNTSVAFSPRNPKMKPLDMLRAAYGDDYYICRFQTASGTSWKHEIYKPLGMEAVSPSHQLTSNSHIGCIKLDSVNALQEPDPLTLSLDDF